MTYSIQNKPVTTVRWFNEAGQVTQEVSGSTVQTSTDYVSERKEKDTIIHGIDGSWQFTLPRKPELEGGHIEAIGATFLHQFRPAPGQTTANIYASGKLMWSVGPFLEHPFGDAHLADDGSVTLLTWKNEEKKVCQVVLVGADGKIRFQVDCGEDVLSPMPLANGAGIVSTLNRRHDPPASIKYVAPGVEPVYYEVGPNASPMMGVQGDLILFRTSNGHEESFQLVHGTNGQPLWAIVSPVRIWKQEGGSVATSAMVIEDLILLLGRDAAAVDLKTGRVVARLESNDPRRGSARFVRSEQKLYAMTEAEFFQIDLSDIRAGRNGWH